MQVYCRTNLDDVFEEWPMELPCRPMVGDLIKSKRGFELQVVQITLDAFSGTGLFLMIVELHIPKYRFKDIPSFQEHYKRHMGEEFR